MKYFLVINSGSSSLKVKIFEENKLSEKISVIVDRVGLARSFLIYQNGSKKIEINFSSGIRDHGRALKEVIKILPNNIYKNLHIIGHRIVHGGEEFIEPVVLNRLVINKLHRYDSFAPIHNPINLKTAQAALMEFPRIKQFGVFDTQFYQDLPEHIYLYSIPIKYYQYYGIRKYGFHGLVHEQMFNVAQEKLGKKTPNLITCHIGNGVSLTAIKEGRVFETSMGLTPISGATMGSRSGDLDPSIPLFLIKELKMSVEEVDSELNFNSGLKGICGYSDFRDILTLAGAKVADYKSTVKKTKQKRALAKLALRIYIYDIQRYLASFVGLLGKIDAVVFSGGVGQNRQEVRESIIKGVTFNNRPKILVVKANEELMIARKIKKLSLS